MYDNRKLYIQEAETDSGYQPVDNGTDICDIQTVDQHLYMFIETKATQGTFTGLFTWVIEGNISVCQKCFN